jgi:hypothetical protein
MKSERRIRQIIELSTAEIISGEETVDSILYTYPEYADKLRPQLEAIEWLEKAKDNLQPRKNFISSTRKVMEAKFLSIQPSNFWQRVFSRYTPQRWVFNLTTPVLLILLLVMIINSLVLTARLSIPGDPLYSTKLFLEDVRLVFTLSPLEKTNLCMEYSRQRTTEFVELVMDGDYELLPAATKRLESDIIASLYAINDIPPADKTVMQPKTAELRQTLNNEISMLRILQQSSPPLADTEIETAIHVAQTGLLALH